MKDKISFSDFSTKYSKNSVELQKIYELNIDYEAIINNKEEMIDNYQKIINSINPQNIKDFEIQSKEYMEKIVALDNEIRNDKEKAGRKAKLIAENKKILELAKERKQKLEKQVLEDYEKNKKAEEKNVSKDVINAQKEMEGYKAQLTRIEEDEEKYPNKAKDSKYKEFLKNKIKEKEQFIDANSTKSAEKQKEILLKEIRDEYLRFKKDIIKEYMPEESRNPNPVLEEAKKQRKLKEKTENEEKDTKKQKMPTEEIIKKIQRETEEQNRNYGSVHLEAGPQVDRVNINKQEQQLKNTFEIENAINKVYKQMQEDNKNITDVRKIEQMTRENKEKAISSNKVTQEKKEKKFGYIEILEKEGNIKYYFEGDKQEHTISIKQALEEKKEKFNRLEISKICKEIAGGRIKGTLLKRKINPEIVAVLENNTEQLKEYINSIYNKKSLPFDLVHNLENTNILSKIKLNRFVKAEEKAGAWVCGKLFDKNRAIIAREKTKAIAGTVKENAQDKASKAKDFVQKIPNKGARIEENAKVALLQKESEKELADNVKKMMQEQEGNEK